MRIFQSFPAALSEVERDLKELGKLSKRQSWQGKDAADADRELVRELTNYQYTVLRPGVADLPRVNREWADAEFKERVSWDHINPGEAWKKRQEVWFELLEEDGGFSYSYNERLQYHGECGGILDIVELLVQDPTTRRAYLTVWYPGDPFLAQNHRAPCSLGYFFQAEGDQLNMTYYMRSCDWSRHFQDDVYLALALRHHIIEQYNEAVDDEKGASGGDSDKPYFKGGSFTHNIANLHVFEKDVAHVF